ncbi:zinc-binding dehydrogenase [Robbsia sp. Bb-Pol-6]|uniref:Zinc-binding dehydrogenase n=1 Tax=Robbsia betulipollinis TaxID=2981849 RepID=A0ABT3ZJS3_9BURK|nr:zinc-binding dehydrogenase [Robbsia betulipollinis]MCY0386788.1 zinc-binding dehydrogenase [Robbsia betulipollinis]
MTAEIAPSRLPETMRAAIVRGSRVGVEETHVPRPAAQEVLVRVHASGMNRADLAVASGGQHGGVGGDGTVVGMEWAGEVVALGAEVPSTLALGDRVMCSGAGGYAQFAVCDHGRTLPVPDAMDFMTAATLPIALQTMHQALTASGGFIAGQSVLIQGASSGVGLLGLQIAKALGAKTVIGTSTNDARRARLADFGADLALDSRDAAWPQRVREATGGGVDLIIDMISGETVNASLAATRICGRIVNVGRLGGARAAFDFDLHALRRIDYVGVTFRTRSREEIRLIVEGVRRDLMHLVADGTLRLPIDRVFALGDAAAALAHMTANAHFGKVLLLP